MFSLYRLLLFIYNLETTSSLINLGVNSRAFFAKSARENVQEPSIETNFPFEFTFSQRRWEHEKKAPRVNKLQPRGAGKRRRSGESNWQLMSGLERTEEAEGKEKATPYFPKLSQS